MLAEGMEIHYLQLTLPTQYAPLASLPRYHFITCHSPFPTRPLVLPIHHVKRTTSRSRIAPYYSLLATGSLLFIVPLTTYYS